MAKRNRIAVIGLKGLPAFGGAANVGENLINNLKDDFEFTVLSTSSHAKYKSSNINGIKQIVFKKWGKGGISTFFYYWRCAFHCFLHKYDLIHMHHSESGFILPFLRLRYNVIVTLHGVFRTDDPKFSKATNYFFKFSQMLNVKFANKVVSVSKPDQQYIMQKYKTEIEYIPNGITINAQLKGFLKSKTVKDYVLFAAGRIYQIKGLHLLLNAAKLINLQKEIIIVGDMNQVVEYSKHIYSLSDGLNVKFVGLIKDKLKLRNLVNQAKLFIFPSLTEAMSLMLLEVISLKTPVIASNIPANISIFNDQELLFFNNDDAIDLSEKIKYAMENYKEMEFRAIAASKKLEEYYVWPKISHTYKSIYLQYLGKKCSILFQ